LFEKNFGRKRQDGSASQSLKKFIQGSIDDDNISFLSSGRAKTVGDRMSPGLTHPWLRH
jgi:hypothetical protein